MRPAASQHTRGGLEPVIVVDPDRAFNVLPHWPVHPYCLRSANFPLYTQPGHLGSLTYARFPGCQVSVNTTNNLASWAKPRRINENERNGRPGCHWPGYFVGHLGNRQFQAPRPTRSRAQLTCPRVAIALRWERTSCPSGRQTPTPGE
jgi:hypothetical protein